VAQTPIEPTWLETLFSEGRIGLFRLDDTVRDARVEPEDESTHQVDIVFIHGLNGDPCLTWTHENGCCWIRDLLPEDLPNARVFTYGYPSQVLFNGFVSGVRHHATYLLHQLLEKRPPGVSYLEDRCLRLLTGVG